MTYAESKLMCIILTIKVVVVSLNEIILSNITRKYIKKDIYYNVKGAAKNIKVIENCTSLNHRIFLSGFIHSEAYSLTMRANSHTPVEPLHYHYFFI